MPRSLTILMVDDDPDCLFQQKMDLQEEGMTIIEASNLKDAREKITKEVFDLVILDLMMEKKDAGLILSYEIKKKKPQMPIILVTAVSSQTGINFNLTGTKSKQWIYADKIMQKPVRKEELLNEINHLMIKSHAGEV